MKKFLASLGILSLVLALAAPALAVDTGDVTATVCPTLISVTIDPTSVDYEVQALDDINLVPSPTSVTITNNGNVAEDFLVKGANATTTEGTWTLSGTADENQYVHRSSPDNSTFTALTTTNVAFVSNVLADSACDGTTGDGGTQDLYLNMDTPTTSTVQGEYSTTVTVTAAIAS